MDEATEGFLPESDVLNFMKHMAELNLPVSPEEIQVRIPSNNYDYNYWSSIHHY